MRSLGERSGSDLRDVRRLEQGQVILNVPIVGDLDILTFTEIGSDELVPLHRGVDGLSAAWPPSPNLGGFGAPGSTVLGGRRPGPF